MWHVSLVGVPLDVVGVVSMVDETLLLFAAMCLVKVPWLAFVALPFLKVQLLSSSAFILDGAPTLVCGASYLDEVALQLGFIDA